MKKLMIVFWLMFMTIGFSDFAVSQDGSLSREEELLIEKTVKTVLASKVLKQEEREEIAEIVRKHPKKAAEAVQICEAAADMYLKKGQEAVFAEINNPQGIFRKGETYGYFLNLSGLILAHPNEGHRNKNVKLVKDVNGKLFVIEYLKVGEQDGSGFTRFFWSKLKESKAYPKINYILRLPDPHKDIVVCAGFLLE